MSNSLDLLNQTLQELNVNNQPIVNDIPKYILDAVIKQESGGDSNAVSSAGAVGLMQLMPGTARDMGLVVNNQVDERFNPEKNIKAGSKYLKDLYNKYKNWEDAFAAYNWGPGNVDKWISEGRDVNKMVAETRNYVGNLSPVANSNLINFSQKMNKLLGGDNKIGGYAEPNEERSLSNIDYVEQGALNSPWQDAWNSFKQGIDQTDISSNYGKLDEYQQKVDELETNKLVLQKMVEQGSLSPEDYQVKVSDLIQDASDAREKIIEKTKNINENEAELTNEPVSKRYQYQNWLVQGQGSSANTWDKLQYAMPQVVGSSVSMMGQQLAATYLAEAGKKLVTAGLLAAFPEPTASKWGAAVALASAAGILYRARNQETYAEIGDNLKQNQQALLEKWAELHPGQEPQEEDLRQIRIQARKGIDDLRAENMALMVPDLVQALIAPESKLGSLFTSFNKPLRWLDETYTGLRDFNKVTRAGSTISRGYLNYFSEKFEEGLQYAAAQRQQDVSLDSDLYTDKGFMRNLLTDAGDVLSSINYSPVGVLRNSDGRYSRDPNFQFAEESGGLLAILPAGIATSYGVIKDLQTYKKVNQALKNNPFADPEEKVLKLKAEIYQNAFENDSVHHLIEGIKSLSGQKDLQGQPLLSKEDAEIEISNIKAAYQQYEGVNSYISTLGGFFASPETKAAKHLLKQTLFQTVLGQLKNTTELQDAIRVKEGIVAKSKNTPAARVEDYNHQILVRSILQHNIEEDIKNKPDEAVIHDYKLKLKVLKNQIKAIEAEKNQYIKDNNVVVQSLTEEASLDLFQANRDIVKPALYKELYDDIYRELRAIKDPKAAQEYLKKHQDLSEKKKKAYDKINEALRTKEEKEKEQVASNEVKTENEEIKATAKAQAKLDGEEEILNQMIIREGNANNIQGVISRTRSILDEINQTTEGKKQSIAYYEEILNEHLDNSSNSQNKLEARIQNYIDNKVQKSELPDKNYLAKLLKEFKSTFDLANDIQNRITELQREVENLEETQADLKSKIEYYNNILDDPRLKNLDLKDLKAKKAKLEKKLTKLQEAVVYFKQLLSESIKLLQYLTKIILGRYESLEDFKKKYRFEKAFKSQTEQLKNLLEREKAGTLDKTSELLLTNYPAIKKEYEALESELEEYINLGENEELVKGDFEANLSDLNTKILKYQKYIRFISDLIDELQKLPAVEIKKPTVVAPVIAAPTITAPTQTPDVNIPITSVSITETVQKSGTLEEMPIIDEFTDAEGFKVYKTLDAQGNDQEVSEREAWYKSNDSQTVTKDSKEKLNGPDHFNNLFSYNLTKQRKTLERVMKTTGKSEAQVLQDYPNAFPVLQKAKPLLAKILNRPDYKDYLSLIVNTKYSDKNKTQNPLVFTSSTGLVGLRNTGIDIILKMTDPDTGETVELEHPYNPDFYAIEDPQSQTYKLFNLDQLDYPTFVKYFEFRNESVTPEKFHDVVQSWKKLRDFKNAITAWYKGKPADSEIPKEYYDTIFTSQLDFITDSRIGFIPVVDVEALKDSPIFYKDENPTKSKWVSENSDSLDTNLISQGKNGYYAVATLPNGTKRWIRLTPSKVMTLEEQVKVVTNSLNETVRALSELDVNDPASFEVARGLAKDLKFFVAGYKDQKIDSLVQKSFDGTSYVLTFRLAAKDHQAVLVPFYTFSKAGNVRLYSYNEFLERINEQGAKIGLSIQASNFRHNLPKSEVENNKKNLHKFFSITLKPNLVTNPSIKFEFYPENIEVKAPVSNTPPVNTTDPKTGEWDPFKNNASDPKHSNPVNLIPGVEDLRAALEGSGMSPEEIEQLVQGHIKANNITEIPEVKEVIENKPEDIDPFQSEKDADEAWKIASIGTPEQYSQYLSTVFPDSKVKSIVYHGSNQEINQFEVKKEPLIHFGSKNAALQRGNVLTQVILNIKNLQIVEDGMWFLGTDEGGLLKELFDRNILTIEQVKNINEVKNKAIQQSPYFHENYRMALPDGEKAGNKKLQEILKDKNIGFKYINFSEDKGSTSYAVPSQDQIHILGSKEDIEGFKNWMQRNSSGFNIDEPMTLNEARVYLENHLPEGFTVEDIRNLHNNTAKNGVPVGAVIGKTMYLRDALDKSDLYHETFHIVFRNLLSDERAQAFLNKAKQEANVNLESEKARLRSTGKYDNFTESELEDIVYEEYLADKFYDWKSGQEVKSWLRQLFDKIMNFIKYAFSTDIEALYNKIENKGFKNSNILKTKFNAKGSFDVAYKLLYGASESLSEEIKYTLAAKMLEGYKFDTALAYYIEFYNPSSEENKKIIAGNPDIKKDFEARYNVYKYADNQKILDEQISKLFKDIKFNPDEVLEDNEENPNSKAFGESDVYTDPYNRTGRKIKNIISTTLYDSVSLGKPIKLALDARTFYARLLPILSINHTSPDMMMPKLQALGEYDVQIKAFYNRMVELTGYSEVTQEVSEKGIQVFNSFKKAFEVYQLPFMNVVYGTGVGEAKVKVIAANKVDLGQSNLDSWNNTWKASTIDILKNKDLNQDLRTKLDKIILDINDNKNTANSLKNLKRVLNTLGINLTDAFLEFSFSQTQKADKLREAFTDIQESSKMTITDLVQIKKIINNKGHISDPFNPNIGDNINYYDRLQVLSNANAKFDPSLILKTYQDSEGKTRYSYTYGNHLLRRAVELKKITKTELRELNKANNGYYKLNPISGDDLIGFNALHNLELGLAGNISTNIVSLNRDTQEEQEKQTDGVTLSNLDSDSMIAAMHIMFYDRKTSGKTGDVTTANYWLSQIGDKATQLQVTLPVSAFWDIDKFTPLAQEKLFNLVKQEFNRNKGMYGSYIQRQSFLLFPFLDPALLEEEEIDSKKTEILAQIEAEFKNLIAQHTRDLRAAEYLDNDNHIRFLPKSTFDSNNYKSLNNYLGNFITNHFIYTTGANQLLIGDIAWTKSWRDWVKRLGGGIASGPTLGDQDFIVLHTTGVQERLDPNTLENSTNKSHPEVEVDDAQVMSTVYTKIHMLDSLGELSPKAKSGLTKIMNEVSPKLTNAEQKEVDLLSAKLVGYGYDRNGNLQYNKQSTWFLTKGFTSMINQAGEEVAQPGKEYLHNIRVSLEAISKNSQPILLSPATANKIYKASKPIDSNSFLKNTIEDVKTDAKTLVPGSSFRKQQENDTKDKDQMVFLRQLFDIIGSEITNPSLRDNELKQFREDFAKVRQNAFNEAKQLLVKEVGDTYERGDLTLWLDAVRRSLETSQASGQLIEFMDGNYDFNLPHVEPKLKELFLTSFKSAFTKKVSGRKCTLVSAANIKFPQDENGRIIPAEVVKASKNPELYTDLRELKIHKLSPGGKEIEEAEILMTRKMAEMQGINITDPSQDNYLKVVASRIPLQSYHSIIVGKIVDFLPDEYGDTIMAPKHIVYLGGMDYDADALYVFLPTFFHNEDGNLVKYGEESSIEEKFYGFKKYLEKNSINVKSELKRLLQNDGNYRTLTAERGHGDDLGEYETESLVLSILGGPKRDAKIQEIEERYFQQALKRFGYPSTLEEFKSAGIESEGITQNRILDNMHKLLRAKELAEAYKTPASHRTIEESIKYLESDDVKALDKNRNNNIIPNTPISVNKAFRAAIQGKGNTGNAVNANTSGAALTENKIELKPDYHFTIGGITYTTFAPEDADKATQREKADAGSTVISGVVDDANKPVSEDLNFDENTIAERNIMIQLGVKDLQLVDSFFAQPSIKRILIMISQGNRLILPTMKTTPANAAQNLLREYYSNIGLVAANIEKRNNQNLSNFLVQEKMRKDVTKQELAVSFRVPNTKLNPEEISKLSDQGVKDLLTKLVNQVVVLKKYIESDYIADYALKWSSTGALNRQLTSEFSNLQRPLDAYRDLLSEACPFVNIIPAIDTNPVLSSNLNNLRDVIKMSKLFFLSETEMFNNLRETLYESLDSSARNSFFIMKQIDKDFKKNFLSFVSGKMQKKRKPTENFDSYYKLIMSEYGTTLASQYNKLLRRDTNGNYLNPEFANNFIVKALKPSLSGSKTNKLPIDLLIMDSRTKFNPKTTDKFIDAVQSLWRSSNPDTKEFARNLLKYCIIKDNLQFANNSILKFIPPVYFKEVAQDLKKLNAAVAYAVQENSVQDLTGNSTQDLKEEFLEIWGRHKVNTKYLFHIMIGHNTGKGAVSNISFKDKNDKSIPVVGQFRRKNNPNLFLEQTQFNPGDLQQTIFRNLITPEGFIRFPFVLKVNDRTYIKVKDHADFSTEYREEYPFGVTGVLPYMTSIKATEEATQKANLTKKHNQKVAEEDLEPYIPQDLDYDIEEAIKEEPKAPVVQNISTDVSNSEEKNVSLVDNMKAINYTNYSGAAPGGDQYWESKGKEFGIGKQVNYTPNTLNSLTAEQLQEVETAYQSAVKALGRNPLAKDSYPGGLVRRDYLQAKAANQILAISTIIEPGAKDKKGYLNKTSKQIVEGGTGYAVEMGIQLGKPVYVFDQLKNKWFIWKDSKFIESDIPVLDTKFAGIGTRELNDLGKRAIESVYTKAFLAYTQTSPEITKGEEISSNSIYSLLGNKTQSENVVIRSWGELKDATTAVDKRTLNPLFGEETIIVSTRIKNSNEHFGNPFSPDPAGKAQGLIKTETVQEAVEKYIDWVVNAKLPSNTDPELDIELTVRGAWIREQLKSGKLKDKSILYYKELGEPSHATALDYLINKYSWNSETSSPESSNTEISSEQLWEDNKDKISDIYGDAFTKEIFLGSEREVQEQLIKCL